MTGPERRAQVLLRMRTGACPTLLASPADMCCPLSPRRLFLPLLLRVASSGEREGAQVARSVQGHRLSSQEGPTEIRGL